MVNGRSVAPSSFLRVTRWAVSPSLRCSQVDARNELLVCRNAEKCCAAHAISEKVNHLAKNSVLKKAGGPWAIPAQRHLPRRRERSDLQINKPHCIGSSFAAKAGRRAQPDRTPTLLPQKRTSNIDINLLKASCPFKHVSVR